MQRSLPEMNEAKQAGNLPFQIYAFHRGGDHPKARKIIEGKDANGWAWALDFIWSTPAFEKQLGGVKGLPSYYVLDAQGHVRGVVKGHNKNTLATLKWLVEQTRGQRVSQGSKS